MNLDDLGLVMPEKYKSFTKDFDAEIMRLELFLEKLESAQTIREAYEASRDLIDTIKNSVQTLKEKYVDRETITDTYESPVFERTHAYGQTEKREFTDMGDILGNLGTPYETNYEWISRFKISSE